MASNARLASSALLALMVTGAAGATASSPSLATSDTTVEASCADYIVIDSRGSGAPPGLSAPGKVFFATFKEEILRRDKSSVVRSLANGYDAWGSIPTLISALLKLPQRYHQSVKEGKVWLSDVIGALLANDRCPDSKIILSGYSQGAQVTGDVYQNISSKRIAGVVLFGDPKFNGSDPSARGGEKGLDGALGTRPSFSREPGRVSAGRVLSYCHAGDPVCQGVSRLKFGFRFHTNYHTLGEPEAAARYLARQPAGEGSIYLGYRASPIGTKLARIGRWNLRTPTFPAAVSVFGRPSTCAEGRSADTSAFVATWNPPGLTVNFYTLRGGRPTCLAPGTAVVGAVTMTGTGFVTPEGVRVGQTAEQVEKLAPNARRVGSRYWLATWYDGESGSQQPALVATLRGGRVSSLSAYVQAGGA